MECAILCGMIFSSGLTLGGSVVASVVAGGTSLACLACFLPETLPRHRRRPLDIKLLLPGCGLKILLRDTLAKRIAFCIVVFSFVFKGTQAVAVSFLQEFLPWTRT